MDVEVTDARLTLGRHVIVDAASIIARSGQVVGVLGPNGSGKSTFLRGIYRALRPVSGTVLVGGSDVWRDLSAREAACRTAALTQHTDVDVNLTVAAVVGLGRAPHGRGLLGRAAGERRFVSEALAAVGLSDKADRPIAQLSGGEQQRVHLARALCQRSEVLILDEPTNHLDVAHQFELLDFIVTLDLTVVMVLHDLNLAAQYCDHVYLMRDGAMVADGSVREVLTREIIADVFGVHADVGVHPASGRPALHLSPLPPTPNNPQ